MNLIIDNENKIEKDYYNALPASIKDIADGMKMAAIHNGQKLSNNDAAKFILVVVFPTPPFWFTKDIILPILTPTLSL